MPFWQVLYEHGVEFVMGGNDHHYERFAPQTPFGDLDLTDGIRQFVVGTGGRFLRPVTDTPPPNSEARDNTTHGILRVGLLERATSGSSCPWTAARTPTRAAPDVIEADDSRSHRTLGGAEPLDIH